jgi:HPt (histidine-containing phosphotransfer) domain-containing protein
MDSPALDGLRQRFITRCRGDVDLIRALGADPSRASEPALRTVIHRISGIAGSLGYADLSKLARVVDDGFATSTRPAPEDFRKLEDELVRVAARD